ncbi:MAG: pilus assembly protein [Planctomycetia bacterium]|nr:pilus assembly protein [Planctomycetia bacterium]
MIMCYKKKKFVSSRRGSLTLEFVLILPIILLMVVLIYQVSVMLMTHQALQSATAAAARVAVTEDNVVNIKEAAKEAVDGWYFADLVTDDTIKILEKTGSGAWQEVTTPSLGSGYVAVQIKLEELSTNNKTKHYWLLPQFKGISATNDTICVSSVSVR